MPRLQLLVVDDALFVFEFGEVDLLAPAYFTKKLEFFTEIFGGGHEIFAGTAEVHSVAFDVLVFGLHLAGAGTSKIFRIGIGHVLELNIINGVNIQVVHNFEL